MKKQITFSQLKKLVREGRTSRRAAPEQFTIRYTDNQSSLAYHDTPTKKYRNQYFTITFDGTLNEVLNFCAYFMNMGMPEEDGSLSEEQYQQALDDGDWTLVSNKEAIRQMDESDGDEVGLPVVFWIKDSKGKEVYVAQWGEEDYKSWDEEADNLEVED